MVHAPKVYITDSGLLAHLLGADEQRLAEDDRVTGLALETFVAMEVMKHAGWSEVDPRVYHFRDSWGGEVDLVLEDRSGRVVAIEVKARASLSQRTPQRSPSCVIPSANSSSRASSSTRASRLFPSATAYGPFPSAGYGHDRTDLLGRRGLGTHAFAIVRDFSGRVCRAIF